MINFNPKDRYGFADLVEIMALLRSPEGCPWDRAQDHASIRRNFIEEVYEAVDAIDQQDDAGLREELACFRLPPRTVYEKSPTSGA